MHHYERLAWDFDNPPDLLSHQFRRAEDLVAWAELDPTIGWKTWPEVWHLDSDGRVSCCFRGSSLCSLARWAEDPYPLVRSRSEGLRAGGCGDDWVIVDSRPSAMDSRPAPSELDAWAFTELRRHMLNIEVRLVDAVVFDDEGRWWSLLELTTGATRWT